MKVAVCIPIDGEDGDSWCVGEENGQYKWGKKADAWWQEYVDFYPLIRAWVNMWNGSIGRRSFVEMEDGTVIPFQMLQA